MENFNFGFYYEKTEEKEKFDLSHLKMIARDKSKTKIYSKFEFSKQAKKDLDLKNISGQVIGIGNSGENNIVLVITTGFKTAKDANNVQVSKIGSFSNTALYNKLIKQFNIDDSTDTYFKLELIDNIELKNTATNKTYPTKAVKIDTLLTEDTSEDTSTDEINIPEEIITPSENTFESDEDMFNSFED